MSNKLQEFLVLFFIFFTAFAAEAKNTCSPEFDMARPSSIISAKNNNDDEKTVYVYFDQSLSMKGYTQNQPGITNHYVNVIDDLQQLAENIGSKTIYHAFGKYVKTIGVNSISQVIKAPWYDCTGSSSECNNQESKIHLPFKAFKLDNEGTFIIVTDLFLSNTQLVGGTLGQLTKPLKSVLKKGKSIGIIGVMSSFNGTIYDIPNREGGSITYTEAQKRPFYIIIIGNQKEINQVKKNLEEQHFNNSTDQYKFSLITSSPILQNLNQNQLISEKNIENISKAEDFKFKYSEANLATYQFDTNKNNEYTFKIDNSEIIVPESNGVSSFSLKEKLWTSKETRCNKIDNGDWREAKLDKISEIKEGPWLPEGEFSISLFKLRPFKKLYRGMRYFYLADIYADKPGNLSEETFKGWSIRDSDVEEFTQNNPVEFKTLNLTKFIKILNSVANNEFKPTLIATLALNFKLLK